MNYIPNEIGDLSVICGSLGKVACFVLWLSFITIACACNENPPEFSSHIDPSLKQKFDASALIEIERILEKGITSRQLKVIIRTKNELNSSQKKKVEATGLTIDSVSGDIFTASGPYAALLKTAGFEFVIYIELSRKLRQK